MRKFQSILEIGRGGFGVVDKVKDETGSIFATRAASMDKYVTPGGSCPSVPASGPKANPFLEFYDQSRGESDAGYVKPGTCIHRSGVEEPVHHRGVS